MITDLLQCSSFISNIDSKTLQNMLPEMTREKWPRGYYFTTNDTLNQRFYILLRGRVKIGKHHLNNGRELTLFLLGPGDGFNIMALIDKEGNSFQLTTLDEVEVLSASVKQWKKWMDQYPVVRELVEEYASVHIQQLSDLASELALDSTMTRLVQLLLRHYDIQQMPIACNLIKGLSQEELAHLVGSVRPVVARMLGDLRRRGLINIAKNGELNILNKQGLLKIVNKNSYIEPAHKSIMS